MTTIPTSELFDAFADDLLEERSMRPLIIIGASKVDHFLFEVLNIYLLPKAAKSGEPDELLQGDRPLSTFSARTKLCYRLGLIDKTLYVAIDKLRALRNPCAHSVNFDPAKSPIREHLADFKQYVANRSSYRLTKERYFDSISLTPTQELQCLLLTLCVLLEAIREKTRVTKGSKIALSIAAK